MQDLPPPNGFGTISVARVQPRPFFKATWLFGALTLITLEGFAFIAEWRKRYRVLKIEQTEHYIATIPFLYAEQERKYLIQLHKIRENERELMKDVPGWKVGTLFGEPVYRTLPKNFLPAVSAQEFAFGRSEEEWLFCVTNPDFFL